MGDNHKMEEVPSPPKSYSLGGKFMLSGIVILFAFVVFVVVVHLYARWHILRDRRRQLLHRRSRGHRRTHILFHFDNSNSTATSNTIRGLEPSVLNSIPEFIYSAKAHPETLECAVCLSEFEENEKGRLLPKCHHSFHIGCIDMWFHSHSTCPLCRSPVEPVQVSENKRSDDVVVSVCETEPGSSSGMCPTCQSDEHSASTSLEDRGKGLVDTVGVTIEVPRRTESRDELGLSSPSSQGYRSPGSRLLSLKRMLSMNKKAPDTSTSCASVRTELDIERGLMS
ncbi:unnamed protein product [Ilex paraguariensis]|uniref:RING-type E3 ubiquitin transferase n=1 Tax=Ilex paraguariensis TaxID=185542 RepID=A0ABC8RM34_9AQUA